MVFIGFLSVREQRCKVNEVLEWAERNGLDNLRSHLECSSIIAREAAVTLGWLATVAGASLAFIANDNWSPTALLSKLGLALLALYLLFLSVCLVFRCLRITDKPSLTNEPANLADLKFSLDQLREVELRNIQDRIDALKALNVESSNSLNRIRIAAVVGLLVAGLGAAASLGIHAFVALAAG